jgi:hypothetical protein
MGKNQVIEVRKGNGPKARQEKAQIVPCSPRDALGRDEEALGAGQWGKAPVPTGATNASNCWPE